MKTQRCLLSALVAVISATVPAHSQSQKVPVRGIVFDSLRGRPLRNAFVTVAGDTRSITTDAQGRFQFDAVSTGKHTFVAQHPLLDSIGLSGLSAATNVSDGTSEVRLAIPSFATLWRVACRGRVPGDSGIVFGTVRNAATGGPVANASVEVSWSDLSLDRRKGLRQRRWNIATETNGQGGFAVCGTPPDLGLRIRASLDSSVAAEIDLPILPVRVHRRDLLIGPVNPSDSADRGSIRGVVTNAAGIPWADARVLAPGGDVVRTDAEGRFVIDGVATGTRQIEVLAIGASPTLAIVDVLPHATAYATVYLERVPVLNAVRTSATGGARVAAMEFEERKKTGLGYVRDSTDIMKYDQFFNIFRDIPSLTTQYKMGALTITVPDGKGSSCPPDVLIDGAAAGYGHLIDLFPKEVAAVEVYARATQVPGRFQRPGIRAQCGMILVWTKYGFRNR
ncbi:MAG TPA: carboxypeptidase regulatory-like domain-containing protein [Gemmatimonadaceae bacterium]